MRWTLSSVLRYLLPISLLCLVLPLLFLTNAPTVISQHIPLFKEGFGKNVNVQAEESDSTEAFVTPTLGTVLESAPFTASSAVSAATHISTPTASSLPINTTIPGAGGIATGDVLPLWRHWQQIFQDAAPKAPPISLIYRASNNAVPEDDTSSRQAPKNIIKNSGEDIDSLRTSHAILLKALESEEIGRNNVFQGKGVVMVAGGEYFGPAIIGIHMLRKSGSDLPVEVFVADQSEYEPKICDEYLPKLGAKCLVLTDLLHGSNDSSKEAAFKVGHYQLKSLAMLFSSFAEILYLDSDDIPLVNPATELFSAEPYATTGLVIWPDFWTSTESPDFWTIAGFSSFPEDLPKSSSEAGQVLVNKDKHLRTLLLAAYYNVYGPDYFYPLLSQGALGQGDKETFMAAAVVLNMPYYRVKTPVKSVRRNDGARWRGTGMVQFLPHDDLIKWEANSETDHSVVRPAFLHANTPKMNAGHLVDEGDLLTVSHDHLRLIGSDKQQQELFGYELGKVIWELLVQTGCELADVLEEWKSRERMCERLKEHFDAVYKDSGGQKRRRASS